jgi:predicted Ser/Thr protein kinase
MTEQRYRVVRRLDSGGMAEVFVGMATSIKGFDKVVAIKRVLPNLTRNRKFVRMFLDEARLSLLLNHTNVVQVFDLGQADGTYFIVMEYIDGVNLKALLETTDQAGSRIGVAQAVFIASEVCKGLSYAHGLKDQSDQPLGIVHRDISPPNILLSEQGEVKIADFGLAKARSQVEHTDPGFVKGKFGYLSPEAAYGEAIDPRTDIFAVGIVLWEMLAGRRLFQGQTDLKTLDLVRKARIPELTLFNADVPPDLETIIYKALARDKSARYQRSDELGNDLTQFLFDHGLKVSSFDIGLIVKEAKGGKAPAPVAVARAAHEAFDEIIQQEISHFISEAELQSVGQATLGRVDGAFEDPAQWFDFADDQGGSGGRSRLISIQAIGPAASASAHDDDAPDLDMSDGPAPMFRDNDAAGDAVDVDFDGSEDAEGGARASAPKLARASAPKLASSPTGPSPAASLPLPGPSSSPAMHPSDAAAAAAPDASVTPAPKDDATVVLSADQLRLTAPKASTVPAPAPSPGWERTPTPVVKAPSGPAAASPSPLSKPLLFAMIGGALVLIIALWFVTR